MELRKIYRYENTWICPWSIDNNKIIVLLYHGEKPPTIYSWRKTYTGIDLFLDTKWQLTDCDQIPGAIDDECPF